MMIEQPFIVAEISANHLGDFMIAQDLVRAAAQCGADAVKFQTYTPEDMVVNDRKITSGIWAGRTLFSLYKEAQTPYNWHKPLFNLARECGLIPFSSPFSEEAVNFLETLDCEIYKVASYELVDTPLIRRIAKTGKRIIMSTGMATESEIETAVMEARSHGLRDITLLKCTSAYPASAEAANLNTMPDMYFRFKTHVGISDHSHGIGVACAAAALGAKVIEKHLTMDRNMGGPDAKFSLEPNEFLQMVTEVRRAAASVGKVSYGKIEGELSPLRRSLYYSQDLPAGTRLSKAHLRTARPFASVTPQVIDNIIGKTLVKAVRYGDPVEWEGINAVNTSK